MERKVKNLEEKLKATEMVRRVKVYLCRISPTIIRE
jgi:hypothetical protein